MDLATTEMYEESVAFLSEYLPKEIRCPRITISCDSTLGLLAETVEQTDDRSKFFDYSLVPHFL